MSFDVTALPGATFGGLVTAPINAADIVSAAEASPAALPGLLNQFNGFLLVKGMDGLEAKPELLLRLSQIFGTEVESYHETRMAQHNVHPKFQKSFWSLTSRRPTANHRPNRIRHATRTAVYLSNSRIVADGTRIKATAARHRTPLSSSVWCQHPKARRRRYTQMVL